MDAPRGVHQRAAAEAGIDLEVRLEPAVDLAPLPAAPLAAGGTDRAERRARAARIEARQGQDEVPRTQRGRIAERCHGRSEERRVGKECRCRWSPEHEKKKNINNTRWRVCCQMRGAG